MSSFGGIGNNSSRTNYNGGNVSLGDNTAVNGDINNINITIGKAGGGDGAKSAEGAEEGGGFNPFSPMAPFQLLAGIFGGGGGGGGSMLGGCIGKCLGL